MARYIIRRILVSIPILLIITFLTFWAVKLGTDPVASYLRVNPRASAEQILAYQEANGLVGSTPEQYFRWLGNFLTGDWGESIKGKKPVFPDIKAALGNTLVLGATSSLVGITIGLSIGILAALTAVFEVRHCRHCQRLHRHLHPTLCQRHRSPNDLRSPHNKVVRPGSALPSHIGGLPGWSGGF